jgi:hypothetical protein
VSILCAIVYSIVVSTYQGCGAQHIWCIFRELLSTKPAMAPTRWPSGPGVHSIMMVFSAQPGEVGGCIPSPFHSIYPLDSSCIAPSTPSPAKQAKEIYLYRSTFHLPFSLVRLKNTVGQMGCTSLLHSSSLHILCYLHKRKCNLRPNTTSSILDAALFIWRNSILLPVPSCGNNTFPPINTDRKSARWSLVTHITFLNAFSRLHGEAQEAYRERSAL